MARMKDGGPAFPVPGDVYIDGGDDDPHFLGGMSLRDWFAGQALPSIHNLTISAIQNGAEFSGPERTVAEIIAADCYIYADAMLAERAKAVQS